MVDKNLFMYDLAVTAPIRNEAPYIKEWIDYHLLAGVNHFYIYNNDSTDNFDEIVQPYVKRGLVTSINFPGPANQFSMFYDSILKHKFHCRYMALTDGDEFIFPQNNKTIPEVLDEIFSLNPNASGLAINWQFYGSNYQEKADYSRGVLERFTRRAPKDYAPINDNGTPGGNSCIKDIVNPRHVSYFFCPHNIGYFVGCYGIDSNGQPVPPLPFKTPVTYDKIVINHYYCKSKEEFVNRRSERDVVYNKTIDKKKLLETDLNDSINNAEFDDSILRYVNHRMNEMKITSEGGVLITFLRLTKLITINCSMHSFKIFIQCLQRILRMSSSSIKWKHSSLAEN